MAVGYLALRQVGARVWRKIQDDNVFGRAAELAYFFLFALFPLMIVFTSMVAMLSAGTELRDELLWYFRSALPWPAYQLIAATLRETTEGAAGKLSLGTAAALLSASAGMVAVIEGLNTAYQVNEARSWVKRRFLAVTLTLALMLFTMITLAVFLLGTRMGRIVAAHVGLGPAFEFAIKVIQWPLATAFAALGIALIYRFAPNVRVQKWRFILPGAAVALTLDLVASAALRWYLAVFDPYSAIYGSLEALIILMLWFYLFAAALLSGGVVNSVLENAAAQAGEPGAKLIGRKAPVPTSPPSGLAPDRPQPSGFAPY